MTLILKDGMHTSEIIKNFVSGFLLNKVEFSPSNGVDLYAITKNDIFMNEIKNQFSKNESEGLDMFKAYVNEIENQYKKKIKRFHSDSESVYDSSLFSAFYKQHGPIHETNAPYYP